MSDDSNLNVPKRKKETKSGTTVDNTVDEVKLFSFLFRSKDKKRLRLYKESLVDAGQTSATLSDIIHTAISEYLDKQNAPK